MCMFVCVHKCRCAYECVNTFRMVLLASVRKCSIRTWVWSSVSYNRLWYESTKDYRITVNQASPANVTLSRTDSSLFHLSWESPSTPLGYEPHNYTVTVSYKDGTTETIALWQLIEHIATRSITRCQTTCFLYRAAHSLCSVLCQAVWWETVNLSH